MPNLQRRPKLSPMFCIKRGFFARQKTSKQEYAIKESAEESMLTDYWQRKDELEEKYSKLLMNLELEEAAEIKCRTARLLNGKGKSEDMIEVISSVKEEYEITRSLILKQKISEIEEIISKCQKKIMDIH